MRKILGVVGLSLLVLTFALHQHYAVRAAIQPSEPTMGSITLRGSEGLFVHIDVQVFTSVEQIVGEADAVVVGKSIGRRAEKRDLGMGRNPDSQTFTQEYDFLVEDWLKGRGEKQIHVAYADYTVFVGTSKLAGMEYSHGNESLKPGKTYILFLRLDDDGYYTSAPQPWMFVVENGTVKVLSPVEGIETFFPAADERAFMDKVK